MPTKKPLSELTDLQLQILDVLWTLGEARATEVHARLEAETGLSRKSIGTLLRRLEEMQFLTHRQEGRDFVFQPQVSRAEVDRARVRQLLAGASPLKLENLLHCALEEKAVTTAELQQLQDLLRRFETEEPSA